MSEIVISVKNVSKDFVLNNEKSNSIKGSFTGLLKRKYSTKKIQHALDDISFDIKKGEFFGIVGRNGSGKSTLLKIIAGIYQPTEGSINVRGKLVPFIELGVGFNPELTGRDNVYLNGAILGFSKKEVDAMYKDIVSFAELERFMDQKLKNYSSGMQVRLAFSMATRAKADILLVDEVLAVGDADFQRKCFDYFRSLKGAGKTVVFVTHDMNAVREYCDRAVLIEDSILLEEGTSGKVASSYTKMFVTGALGAEQSKNINRWGNGAILYTEAKITSSKLTDNDDYLNFAFTAKATRKVDSPIFGFLIKTATHTQLLGTNTVIMEKKIKTLQANETIELKWKVPNIFNDGLHYIDPAITYSGGVEVADWWEEAITFRVLRNYKTPYLVNPVVNVDINKEN